MKLLEVLNKLFTPIFVGHINQIPIFIHWFWLWILIFITPVSFTSSLLICSILLLHLLHEAGHLLSYWWLNIKPEKIIIYPTGGYSSIKHVDNKTVIITSIAGPLVNILLIPILHLFEGAFYEKVIFFNYCILFFNILPAIPLDMGLILQHFLKDYYLIFSKILVTIIGLIGIVSSNLLLIILSLLLHYVIQEEKTLQ